MVFKCKNCGAKLNVDKNDEMVTCEYCDSVNKVEFSQFDFYRNMSTKSKKYIKISIFITLGMIAFGIVSSLVFDIQSIGPVGKTESSSDDYYYGTFKYTYHQNGGYLINNNNDDYLDIVSIALNVEDSENYLQILNGKTGEKIKSIKINKEKKPKLFVLDQNYICVSKEDFTVSIYEKENLFLLKTFSVSDKLNKYTYNNNTLYFQTHDDNLWSVDLESFKLISEDPENWYEDYSIFKLKSNPNEVAVQFRPGIYMHTNIIVENEISYSAKLKEKSSKDVFSISAERENEILWNIPLGYEDDTWRDGPVIILAEQNIVTFGKKFTSDNMGYLIGIDKTDGRIKYEALKTGKSCKLNDFYYNGRYIIANIWGSFHAFDPSTGETKWMAGRKCE